MTKPLPSRRPSSVRKWLFRLLLVTAAGLWMVFLRPAGLGGSVAYVVVAGDSMLPTYSDGTLVVSFVRPTYAIGDVVTFAVDVADPTTRPLVIHRIVAGTEAEGFTTQGDNRPFADPWTVRPEDIVGAEGFGIPGIGQALLMVRSPAVLASIFAAVATYVALGWPPSPKQQKAYARRATFQSAEGSE